MPGGEAFTPAQRDEIARAIRIAEESSGFAFAVYVGAAAGEPRMFAGLVRMGGWRDPSAACW